LLLLELELVFCRLYFWWVHSALFQDNVKLKKLKTWIHRNTISVLIVPYIITMSNFDIYFFIFEFTRINALQDDKFTQTQWRSYFFDRRSRGYNNNDNSASLIICSYYNYGFQRSCNKQDPFHVVDVLSSNIYGRK
jgi:hypothetical protein